MENIDLSNGEHRAINSNFKNGTELNSKKENINLFICKYKHL